MRQQTNNIKMHAEIVMVLVFLLLVIVVVGYTLQDLGTIESNIQQIVIESQEISQ